MPLKDTERDAEVIERDGKTYYRDVYAFTNRVRMAALTRSEAKIIRIIDTCLRGEADQWWNYHYFYATRAALIQGERIEPFCQALEERFRLSPTEAYTRYENCKYTVDDVQKRRPIGEYVASIEYYTKACGIISNQPIGNAKAVILHAWRYLDIALRQDIDEPDTDDIDVFIRLLQRKQANWYDKFTQRNTPQSLRETTNSRQPASRQAAQRPQPNLQYSRPWLPEPQYHAYRNQLALNSSLVYSPRQLNGSEEPAYDQRQQSPYAQQRQSPRRGYQPSNAQRPEYAPNQPSQPPQVKQELQGYSNALQKVPRAYAGIPQADTPPNDAENEPSLLSESEPNFSGPAVYNTYEYGQGAIDSSMGPETISTTDHDPFDANSYFT